MEGPSTGDDLPAGCQLIEIHVAELRQMFDAIDPSPFHERDLDAKAEEFIVGWALDVPKDAPLALLVHLDRETGVGDEAAVLRRAVAEHFSRRAQATRRRLRQLLRVGRTALLIGLAVVAASIVVGDLVAAAFRGRRMAEIVRESLLIGSWVAMWRPIEIFLYDWWPVRAEARLFDRLAAMPVRIRYAAAAAPRR